MNQIGPQLKRLTILEDNMNEKFLVTVGDETPYIMCERHAQVFEKAMIVGEIPHTIIELEEEDAPEHCHACDLVVAKEYAKRVNEQSRIILPGEFI
jgi:hypothetical protein